MESTLDELSTCWSSWDFLSACIVTRIQLREYLNMSNFVVPLASVINRGKLEGNNHFTNFNASAQSI